MLKIILINPPSFNQERYGKDLKRFGAASEPLGLAYLASNLEKHNYDVSIIDSAVLGLSPLKTAELVRREAPDLVGLTMLTPMYGVVSRLAVVIKEQLSEVKIVLGGAHATALPEDTLLDIKEADYICAGEGENTIVDLADFLSGKGKISEIDGLVYKDEKGKIVFNKPRKFEDDLDKFPLPARHLLPMNRYQLTISRVQSAGYCPTLILARGCPFNCSFCSHPFGRSFRHHSVGRIISELGDLIGKYQVSQVNLEADTLTADKPFLTSLCQALVDSGISRRIKWTCESRIDTVDFESLKAMKKAGCWQISYGVESGVQRLLDLINKGVKLEKVEEIFFLTKKAGISIRGFFMLGLPTETVAESWQTINSAKLLNPLWAQFTVTIPYPGTPLFKSLRKQGKIKHYIWDNYNTWSGWSGKEMPFVPENRSAGEIRDLQKKAAVAFYLRPRTFIKFAKQIKSFEAFKKYLFGFLVVLKYKIRDK